MDVKVMECPFCGWKAQTGEYEMLLVSYLGCFYFRLQKVLLGSGASARACRLG